MNPNKIRKEQSVLDALKSIKEDLDQCAAYINDGVYTFGGEHIIRFIRQKVDQADRKADQTNPKPSEYQIRFNSLVMAYYICKIRHSKFQNEYKEGQYEDGYRFKRKVSELSWNASQLLCTFQEVADEAMPRDLAPAPSKFHGHLTSHRKASNNSTTPCFGKPPNLLESLEEILIVCHNIIDTGAKVHFKALEKLLEKMSPSQREKFNEYPEMLAGYKCELKSLREAERANTEPLEALRNDILNFGDKVICFWFWARGVEVNMEIGRRINLEEGKNKKIETKSEGEAGVNEKHVDSGSQEGS